MHIPVTAAHIGAYENHRPLHDRAKELTLETLRKKIVELEGNGSNGSSGIGDVSGPDATSDTL